MNVIKAIYPRQFVNFRNFSQCLTHSFELRVGSNVMRFCTSESVDMKASIKMQNILEKRFPKAKKIIVNDISGGCGSMFEIFVETVEFKGLPLVKQHMLINETLKDQIKDMHGLTVKTKVPDAS